MMQSGFRFGLAGILTLTLLALAGTSTAEYCTPETCVGLVSAYYQYSNCTGDVLYEEVRPPFPVNECLNASSVHSFILEVTEDYWEYREHYGSADCGRSDELNSYEGFRYYLSTCMTTEDLKREDSLGSKLRSKLSLSGHSSRAFSGPASSAFLLNVNVTMERQDPVEVSSDVPFDSDVRVTRTCDSVNNCTFNGEDPLYYTTYSTNDTCVEQTSSVMIANITAGAFYRGYSQYAYNRFQCIDDHTIFIEMVSADGQRTLSAEFYSQVCGPNAGDSQFYCLAAPTPMTPSPPVPVASSPSTSYSLFVIMIAFVLAIIISF